MKTPLLLAVFVAPMLLISPIEGQVYRCKTPGGGTEYSQIPCGRDAQLLQDRSQSVYTGPHVDPFDWIRREQEGRQAREAAYQAEGRRIAAQQPERSAACTSALTMALEALNAKASNAAHMTATAAVACNRPDIAAAVIAQSTAQSTPIQQGRRPSVGTPPTTSVPNPAPTQNDRRTLTGCDSSGCYDNKGARYNNMGENFMGPNGMCRKTALGWSCP